MDTRVSLEVFFVEKNEICHTYKSQIHVWTYRYRPVSEAFKILRFMVLSFEIKTKYFNQVKLNSIIGVFEARMKKSLKSVLWFVINMTYAEKRAWKGFWNVLFVY